MKGVITVEVPDEFLAARADSLNAEAELENDPDRTNPALYFETCLRELVVDDSLPLALFSWPVEVSLEVVPSV